MKAVLPVLALLGLAQPALAQAPNASAETVELTVCNDTDYQVRIMYYYNDERLDRWMLSGWQLYKSNECKLFSKFVKKGAFYYHGTQDESSVVFRGRDRRLCVSSRPVFRAVYADEKCLSGERLEGFREQKVSEETYTLRINK